MWSAWSAARRASRGAHLTVISTDKRRACARGCRDVMTSIPSSERRRALGDHDRRAVGVARRQARHDGSVDDAQLAAYSSRATRDRRRRWDRRHHPSGTCRPGDTSRTRRLARTLPIARRCSIASPGRYSFRTWSRSIGGMKIPRITRAPSISVRTSLSAPTSGCSMMGASCGCDERSRSCPARRAGTRSRPG